MGEQVKADTCSDDEWADLWEAYHSHRTPTVRVPRAALEHVVADCGSLPENLIDPSSRKNGKAIIVDRAGLFEYLKLCAERYGQKA